MPEPSPTDRDSYCFKHSLPEAEETTENAVVVDAVEREQQRIAQVLHDTACQTFSGLYLNLRVLARKIESSCPEAAHDVKELSGILHRAAGELYDIARSLRSVEFNGSIDVAPYLEELTKAVRHRVACELHCPNGKAIRDPHIAAQLVKIAQGAVDHALSSDTLTRVALSVTTDKCGVRLTVDTEGHQFGGNSARLDAGLELLWRRAEAIGATISIESDNAKGSILSCYFPTSG